MKSLPSVAASSDHHVSFKFRFFQYVYAAVFSYQRMPISSARHAVKHPTMIFVSLLLTPSLRAPMQVMSKASLADIMSSVVLKAKAQAAQSKITELINQGLKTQSLLTCVDYYDIIIEFQISKQAYRGIKSVQPRKIALQAMDDTVALVNDCNNGLGRTFRGSPLVVMNANVINLAIVTKAIVQQLT